MIDPILHTARIIVADTVRNGGATWKRVDANTWERVTGSGQTGGRAWLVAVCDPLAVMHDDGDLARMADTIADLMREVPAGWILGTWTDTDNRRVYVDDVAAIGDETDARSIAQRFGQQAIFNIDTKETVMV